ncbi:tail fiber domain-containing protein [Olleya sp. HaHaR_3_96]|uniref:tail fiber domain-containing protein n=1 Tax=Olleya sp. HaHaR_3_96 TaxID=2745560 RepID=UPI001C4F9203|nr:tail fiber domain-containing protein [Olleya sp. HaHaR_3_96]QXP60229.1 tail fiber domain-containing protein [Olleya sp. HaHaR_3_96]
MKLITILAIAISLTMVTTATAQLQVLQNGNTIVGGGNSSFPYATTKLSVNGSTSVKSRLEIMNLNNTNTGWGGQIRFTSNNLSGINHLIADNGAHEMILFPGYSHSDASSRKVSVFGALNVYGYASLAGGGYFSDRNLKENITKLEGSLDKVLKLQGVNFSWKKGVLIKEGDEQVDITSGLPNGKQLGFIAQDVEAVVPEVVNTTSSGYKSLEYHTITALLVEAMKEQQSQIKALEEQLTVLNEVLEKQKEGAFIEENVSVSLSQNIPNPFADTAKIRYSLPESYGDGVLMISDLQGKALNTIALKVGLDQVLEISSEKLQNGIYLYSMVVEGKVLKTRRFVISK